MTVVINGTTGIDTGTGSLIAADSTTPTYLDLFEDTDNGSNYVRLIAPTSVAANRTITLPDATGTAVVGSAAVSAVGQIPFSTDGATYTPTAKIVSGTSVTASGTSVDFTGIPSWAKRVTMMLNGVSTNGSSGTIVRLGTSGGIVSSGYNTVVSIIATANNTTRQSKPTNSFFVMWADLASYLLYGNIVFTNLTGNTWTGTGLFYQDQTGIDAHSIQVAGAIALSGTLDRVRLTTINGTDAFDAGTINILYE